MRLRRGFSLIELLITIGVIAVLAAVFAPVYMTAKKNAARAKCQSNLQQIARAFESYTSDYNSCYPNLNNQYLWAGFSWRECMRKYVALRGIAGGEGNRDCVLACPSDPTPPGIYAATSYAYSAAFYMTPQQVNAISDSNYIRSKFAATNPILPCSTIKAGEVKYASRKVLVTEYWTLHSASPKVGWYDDETTGNDPWSGERNYLFADGHVRFIPTKKIHSADSPDVDRSRSLPDINLTTNGVAGKDID